MKKVLFLNVVGLTPALIGSETPHLSALTRRGTLVSLGNILPALTCSAQSSMLTGRLPKDHGIVGNGWYFRELAEVWLWRQSNQLVHGDRLWEVAKRRDPGFTAANLFWWYNMATTVDYSLTPRPLYFADGRKAPGLYGRPASFAEQVRRELPPFPLFQFWGPGANLNSSQWIADSAIWTMKTVSPTLVMVYLPHLDYDFQRFGPKDPRSLKAVQDIDQIVGRLIRAADDEGRDTVVVSEYGITEARGVVHINRILRDDGWLETTPMLDRELLDPAGSRAFALADHQIAHVYIRNPSDVPALVALLEKVHGIDEVLYGATLRAAGLDHPRSGEIVLVAAPGYWFTYYYWLNDNQAPDFARTVEIHRKPGYDPAELFLDPRLKCPKVRIAAKVLGKKLGFRTVMDLIPLDANLVRGTHGRAREPREYSPVFLSSRKIDSKDSRPLTDVFQMVLEHVFPTDG